MLKRKHLSLKLSWRWLVLLAAALLLNLLTVLVAEGLWFQEVAYLQVFWLRLVTQTSLGLLTFGASLGCLLANQALAHRAAWPKQLPETDRPRLSGHLRLRLLLPLALLLSWVMSLLLVYCGQLVAHYWTPNQSLVQPVVPLALKLRLPEIWQAMQGGPGLGWWLGLSLTLAIALLIYPRWGLRAIAVLFSVSLGLLIAEQWSTVLLALHPVRFDQTDPLFERDLSLYIFSLPVWELLAFWLSGLLLLTLLSSSLIYLLSGDSLSQGQFPGFTPAQQRHLHRLAGLLLLAVALEYWLDRYNLLRSSDSASYGASYTDVYLRLPIYTLLSLSALAIGLVLIGRSLGGRRHDPQPTPSSSQYRPTQRSKSLRALSERPPLFYRAGGYFLVAALVGGLLPIAMQRFAVQPNELQLEQPYIQRTIAFTQAAFSLNRIDAEEFDPQDTLNYQVLQRNNLTVENIRLWDKRPLLETNRQLQRIRLYYEFLDADIDRYWLPQAAGGSAEQQVFIAARELNYSDVPTAAQTWINEHLIYTHGYGFTVSPVNVTDEGGLPDYYVQGIEPVIVNSRVGESIPVGRPRIYYGELTRSYVMTETRVKELDYPSGSDNVYNTYEGRGGVALGAFWQRLIFAIRLRDWRMLLTDDFTPQTRLLFRRTITDRVKAIAPFLRFDSDPYLVVANTGGKTWERGSDRRGSRQSDPSYLYWMIDAYTTSDRYPYSDAATYDFNYVRNSVKVVVDAYHGSVNFYTADPQDPIIRSWQQILPTVFQPLSQMPTALRGHIRYPQDFYQVQAQQLMTYHMSDPIVFYNREDQWRAPNEIYGDQPQVVQPYYLITKLPSGSSEEFILLYPFTPVQRNNLIAWLAARSDGDQYGNLLLYEFPKQKLVYGPEQIEARINQDPVISQRISLWNRQGSRATQGNLLVIPIEQSLLYVEPLYLEATQNQLPTLVRVIVTYGNRIAMAETLRAALDAVFRPAPADSPIVRPIEEEAAAE